MSEPSPSLLSEERLAEIRAQLEVPRARNSYVTDYGMAADVVEELLDHLDATRQAVAEQLRILLTPADVMPMLDPADRTRCFIRNTQVQNAARALHIDLLP